MQYLNRSENYIEPSLTLEERAKKALALRQQHTLFEKQATFDNFGLARPKCPFTFATILNLGNGKVLATEIKSGREWISADYGLTWSPWRSPV